MQHERVARCEVVVLHLAMFGNGRVRFSRVAPCDISLVILCEIEPDGEVDANDLGVSEIGRASGDNMVLRGYTIIRYRGTRSKSRTLVGSKRGAAEKQDEAPWQAAKRPMRKTKRPMTESHETHGENEMPHDGFSAT